MAVAPTGYTNGKTEPFDAPSSPDVPRTRYRRGRIKYDEQQIGERVCKFFEDDLVDASVDRDRRIQREAKLRMWSEGKDWPWEGSSDVGFPDIMEKSLRIQDTLHNAVMSQQPPVIANALNPGDRDKQRTVERLLSYQFFCDQRGESMIGDMADAFVNDGHVVVYTPWIKDRRKIVDTRTFGPIPDGMDPREYFDAVIRQIFGRNATFHPTNGSKYWDWRVTFGKSDTEDAQGAEQKADVSFYTKDDGDIEVVIYNETTVFDGPCPMVLDDDDVLTPARAANLQAPSPSNPRGATHVIIRFNPTVDDIVRLVKSGYYDGVDKSQETIDRIVNYDRDTSDEEMKDVKDALQGEEESKPQEDRSHRTLTLLVCYDLFDADNDGRNEDVVWWVIKENKMVLRARYLTEICPVNPPRRPFSESSFIPVRGRRKGISLIEMLEGMHDLMKKVMDQAIDTGQLANSPFFFYRKTSAMAPQAIRLWPGEGYPLADPSRDVNFPQIGNPNAQGFALNLFTLIQSMEERLSVIGDLQLGRVPAGKSSALRTIGGMSLLQGQGEARPERILRRFFMCLTDVWSLMHSLNRVFLPRGKQIRILGPLEASEDPYQKISDKAEIGGNYQFTFKANILNTSREALKQSIGELMGAFVSPLTLQLGLIDQDGIYRLFRTYAMANGQDVDEYLIKPTPQSNKPKITAEQALGMILNDIMPDGAPMEGLQAHFQKVYGFHQTDDFGLFTQQQVDLYKEYVLGLQQQIQQALRQQEMMAAAQQFQQTMQGRNGGQGGRPAQGPPPSQDNPRLSGPAELLDESMPGAGGGTVQ